MDAHCLRMVVANPQDALSGQYQQAALTYRKHSDRP
jgi:hypothetical protein